MAANTYINEREEKRSRGMSIEPHRLFSSKDSGKLVFKGVRHIGNQAMALLKRADDKHVLVLPIADKIANRLKSIQRDDVITATAQGELTLKSKSIGIER